MGDQRTQNGCGRLKNTINLYHTNNRLLINGKQAAQFNHEHGRVSHAILQSEKVSEMDNNIYLKIEECLKAVSVKKTRNDSFSNKNPGRQTSSERRVDDSRSGTGPDFITENIPNIMGDGRDLNSPKTMGVVMIPNFSPLRIRLPIRPVDAPWTCCHAYSVTGARFGFTWIVNR